MKIFEERSLWNRMKMARTVRGPVPTGIIFDVVGRVPRTRRTD
jgi:hypothetical protein